MAVLRLVGFGGQLPQLNEYLLAPNKAVLAENVVLWTGALTPLKSTQFIANAALPTNPVTLYRYNSFWFEWNTDVNAVPSLNANDAYDRVYFTGDGSGLPRVTHNAIATGSAPYPSAAYTLGVPPPASAPTGVVAGAGSGSPETRFYVVTLVNEYGEEGPPSPKSEKFTVEVDQTVQLTLPGLPAGNYNFVSKRIYRVNTSDTTAVYQLVAEVSAATTAYEDNVLSEDLADALPSATWDPPPSDIGGLVSVPGSFLAAFRKNELLFSEPGLAHAWPVEYRKSVDATVVGLAPLETGFAVVTKGVPYLAVGSHPASLGLTRVDVPYSCIAKRGIAVVNDAAVYPTPRGLARVSMGGASLITEGVFDQQDWDALNPSSIRGYRWRNLYVAFYTVGQTHGGFIIDPASPLDGVVSFTGLDVGGGFVDLALDRLYLSVNREIVEWGAGAAQTYTWKSKPFQMARPEPLHVIQVRADAYPVTITILRDGVQQAQFSVTGPAVQQIPGAAVGRTYQIQIGGTQNVREVWIGSSLRELRSAQDQVA